MTIRFKTDVSKVPDPDSTRYAINGAMVVESDADVLSVFATDARVLVCTHAEGEIDDTSVIVPGKLCTPKGPVEFDGNRWEQDTSTRKKKSAEFADPIEGQFPLISRVIREYGPRSVAVTIDPQKLLNAFLAMNHDEKNRGITLIVPLPEVSQLLPTVGQVEHEILKDYPDITSLPTSGLWALGVQDDGWFELVHAADENYAVATLDSKLTYVVTRQCTEGEGAFTIADDLVRMLSNKWKTESRVAEEQVGLLVGDSIGLIMPFDRDKAKGGPITRHNRLVRQYKEDFIAAREGRSPVDVLSEDVPEPVSTPNVETAPVAVVSPEVADAFDMHNLPNTIVQEPEPLPDTGADAEPCTSMTVEEVLALLS